MQTCEVFAHLLYQEFIMTLDTICIHFIHVILIKKSVYMHVNVSTIDRERFPGLIICSFSIIRVFAEIFSCCLDHKYSLLT